MADPPTLLSLPTELPYPITITRMLVTASTSVRRGDTLLEYSFLSATRRRELAAASAAQSSSTALPGSDHDMVGSWESPVDGDIVRWEDGVRAGQMIERRQASKPILRIQQACTHPVQLHGMCGICGADITNDDYLSRPAESEAQAGPSRYPGSFELAHDALGVTVSTDEARRLENLSRDSLLASRRLSLIVDLDQTIIHTTVDPTVGEWMAEIEEDEREAAIGSTPAGIAVGTTTTTPTADAPFDSSASAPVISVDVAGTPLKGESVSISDSGEATSAAAETTTPPSTPPPQPPALLHRRRERNPDADALRDVARFQLADDLPPGAVKRGRMGPEPVRWYYTKPRPGLEQFLLSLSQLYEMHVYTMGTRTYADSICKVIDPDGKIFGGRILSRDESGSMSSKSLMRLFPTDQSMVVVIDDRADVWGDCPNLVKVVPYDFFIGIGDINGAFLPPTPSTPGTPPLPVGPVPGLGLAGLPTPPDSSASPSSSSSPSLTSSTASDSDVPSTEEGLIRRAKLLDEVSENRPLAKLQEELEHAGEAGSSSALASGTAAVIGSSIAALSGSAPVTPASSSDDSLVILSPTPVKADDAQTPTLFHEAPPSRKPILNPNDGELDRVGEILREVHASFYAAYDERDPRSTSMPLQCDTPLLIEEIKDRVLRNCVIVFSGVIPRNLQPDRSEIWQMAESFGAMCVTELSDKVTHCVTATMGTEKTHRASKMPRVKLVWVQWLQQSMALWEGQDEERYLALRPSAPGSAGSSAVPSRPETPTRSRRVIHEGEVVGDDVILDEEAESALGISEEDLAVEAAAFDGAWDEEAQREFDAFLDGSSDWEGDTDAGDVDIARDENGIGHGDGDGDGAYESDAESYTSSAPATPGKKRVRYADEEHLPLESFKDPLPDSHASPRKKRKPLLLEAPIGNEVPEANRFLYKGGTPEPAGLATTTAAAATATVGNSSSARDSTDLDGVDFQDDIDDDDDEFAKMLSDSLAEGGGGLEE